jgi:flagellar protein FlaG
MDIPGLKGIVPLTSGTSPPADKTPRAATVADAAPGAVSAVVQPPSPSSAKDSGPAIAAELQAYLQTPPHPAETTVQYSLDQKTGLPVVTVRNAQSGDIVRQLPVEVAARLLENFSMGTGALLDQKI